MLNALSQFANEHAAMGWIILLIVFIIIGKAERLADRWIDSQSDSEREYRRERRERIEAH